MISSSSSFGTRFNFRFVLQFAIYCSTYRIINAFVAGPPPPYILVSKRFGQQPSLFLQSDDGETMKRGDARGAALLVENLSVSRGSAQILSEIEFRVEPKSKWGVVGTICPKFLF